jgi:hypothetical protein
MGAVDIDEKQLVMARLETLPSNIGVAVGSDGNYTKEQLLEHVDQEDEIGVQFIDLDLQFLRALKTGSLFNEQNLSTN